MNQPPSYPYPYNQSPPPKRSNAPLVALALVIVLAGAAIGAYLVLLRPAAQPTALAPGGTTAAATTSTATPAPAIAQAPSPTVLATSQRVSVPPSATPTQGALEPDISYEPVTPPPGDKHDVEIADYGFSVVGSDLSYAIVLHNPNPAAYVATYFDLQTTFSDASGPVDTEQDTVAWLGPGQDTAVTGFASSVDGHPDRMEVRLGTAEWVTIDYAPGTFTFAGVHTSADQFGATTKGSLTSNFHLRQENVQLDAVYYDSAGKIIGGDFTYVDFVDPDSTVSFKIAGFTAVKGIKSTSVYWQF